MNPTSHRSEVDLLRRQVADLARELAERDRVLHERTRHLQAAQALAHLGSWNWDIASGEVDWSDELYRIFGYEPRSRAMTFDSFVSAVLPDDHDRVRASFDDALTEAAPFDMECRIVRADGQVRTLHCRGQVERDGGGQPIRMSGTALDITDRKQTELALQQREAHYRALIEHSSDITTVLDPDGAIRFESPSFERLLGYARHELHGRIAFECIHQEDLPVVTEKFRLLFQQPGTSQTVEFRLRHKDGSWRDVEAIGRAIRDPDGRCSMIGNARDITERKRAEAMLRTSQEKLRQALQASCTGLWDWNTETNEVVFSDEWKHQLGYEPAEMSDSFEAWTALLHPEDRDAAMAYARDYVSRREGEYRQAFRLRHKDGGYRWIEARASFVTEADGRRIRLLGSHTDMTDRKRMEEAVRDSEVRYRTLVELSPSGVIVFSEGRTVYVNRTGVVIMGAKDPHEILNRSIFDFIHHGYHQDVRENVKRLLSGGVSVHSAERIYLKMDGTLIPVQVEAACITWDGKPAIVNLFSDITERKRTEEALRASEERYARATAIGKVGVWELDVVNGQYHGDTNLKALFGYESDELSTDPFVWLRLVHSEDQSIVMRNWELVQSGAADAFHCELRHIKKDGSIVWGDVRARAVRDRIGQLTHLTGATVDITERKQADEALRISEERFAKAFQASPHPVVISELDSGRVVDANDAACQLLGYHKEHVAGQTTLEIGLWHSLEERTRYLELLKRQGSVRSMEVSLRTKDGDVRQCLLSSELIELNGKQCSVTVGDDITESKRLEKALRLTQFSVDQAVEAILWVDPSARIFNVNDTACRMLECSRQDLMAMTVHDIDPNFPVARWAEHWNHLKQRGALTFEAKFWSRTGGVLETEVTVNYLQHEGKEYGCMILRDVGERTRAEAELHRSHTFLRQVIDTDPNFIFAKDRDGRFAMANKAVADWYGTTVEGLIGKSDADFNAHADEVECFRQNDMEVIHSARDRFIPEEKITDATGRTCWLQTVKRPLFDDQGRVQMVLGAATDITERKRMEEILVQREQDLSAALQERERISQDLHDGILQSLYAVGLGLEVCKLLMKEQPEQVAVKFMTTLDQAIGQLNQIMTEVRNFIAGLESQVMQGGDFSTALRTMIEAMSVSSSARCRVKIDAAAARRLSTEQALHSHQHRTGRGE